MGDAPTARSGVNYLALICAVAIVAVPGVIIGSLLLVELDAFPRAANIFDTTHPLAIIVTTLLANISFAIGSGIVIYGIAFKRAAARGDGEFAHYFKASLWALIGVYLAIHLASAVYISQQGGASPWLAVMGPIGYVALGLVYSSMTDLGVFAAVGGVAACIAGTALVAFLYWRLSGLPAFASSLPSQHLKGVVIAGIVAALTGAVLIVLSFARVGGLASFPVALAATPFSTFGAVAEITVVALVSEAVFARRGARPELFGWMGAFAIGLPLIGLAETALIAVVSLFDTSVSDMTRGFLLHRVITLPQAAVVAAAVGFVYGRIVGAREFSWTTDG